MIEFTDGGGSSMEDYVLEFHNPRPNVTEFLELLKSAPTPGRQDQIFSNVIELPSVGSLTLNLKNMQVHDIKVSIDPETNALDELQKFESHLKKNSLKFSPFVANRGTRPFDPFDL
jgi:hypothetical protein